MNKTLSFDVGIKNLAYCVMSKQNDKTIPFKVYDWNIINVLNQTIPKCSFDIEVFDDASKNKPCSKNASFVSYINNTEYFFCRAHKVKHTTLLNTNNLPIFNGIAKNTHKCIKCNKNATFEYNNEHYCTIHKNSFINAIKKNTALKSVKQMNCNNLSIDDIKIKLFNILDNMPNLLLVDNVIIENQPSLKNPKMKSIANALWDYFVIRGIIDKKNNSTIKTVQFICPSNKLKVDEDLTIKTLSSSKDDTQKYKLTKQLAVIYCKQLLKNDAHNLNVMNNHVKKDDLADCFLQGCWFLTK